MSLLADDSQFSENLTLNKPIQHFSQKDDRTNFSKEKAEKHIGPAKFKSLSSNVSKEDDDNQDDNELIGPPVPFSFKSGPKKKEDDEDADLIGPPVLSSLKSRSRKEEEDDDDDDDDDTNEEVSIFLIYLLLNLLALYPYRRVRPLSNKATCNASDRANINCICFSQRNCPVQSAGAVEYTNCISAER